jgi:hypothetical protein
VRDSGDIKAETLKQDLGIPNKGACAQLGTGIMGLFEHKRTRGQFRSALVEVKGCGDAGGATADDEDVIVHENILLKTMGYVKQFRNKMFQVLAFDKIA